MLKIKLVTIFFPFRDSLNISSWPVTVLGTFGERKEYSVNEFCVVSINQKSNKIAEIIICRYPHKLK